MKLTDRYVDSLGSPASGRNEVSDSVRPGLRLRVAPTGRKTWIFEKRIKGGVKRKHTLGPYPRISISDARVQAAELELEAIRGIDSVQMEREAKEVAEAKGLSKTTVADVFAAYDRLHIQNLRTAGERRRMLTQALEPFFQKSIADLNRRDLQAIIDNKANLGALVYANRFKAALAHFARFAWNRGYTDTHIGDGLTGAIRETPRDRVLSLNEMHAIWDATLAEAGVFGPLVRLLMLTAQRRGDISKLQWAEVNFERQRIDLVSARTKNARAHVTPLSVPAMREFQALGEMRHETSAYIFTTNGRKPVSGFSVLKKRLDSSLGKDFEPWRFHDFRTSFATVMAESGEPETLVDRVLNHVASGSAPSAVARVYDRSSQLPQRARLLDKWADMVSRENAEVVRLIAND